MPLGAGRRLHTQSVMQHVQPADFNCRQMKCPCLLHGPWPEQMTSHKQQPDRLAKYALLYWAGCHASEVSAVVPHMHAHSAAASYWAVYLWPLCLLDEPFVHYHKHVEDINNWYQCSVSCSRFLHQQSAQTAASCSSLLLLPGEAAHPTATLMGSSPFNICIV